jgi:hypothetical protein
MAKKAMGPAPKKKGGDPGKGAKTLPQVTVKASRIVDQPAKKPSTINKRAPLMDVPVGKKGYRMSIDTTNMNKPDEQTYNYTMRDSTGKVTSKGNIARSESKAAAKQLVNKLKAKK